MRSEKPRPKRAYQKPRVERRQRLAAVTEELPRGSGALDGIEP